MSTPQRVFQLHWHTARIAGFALALMLPLRAPAAHADSNAIDFETPTYTVGSIDGQDGWSATGAYDYGVVATSGFGSPAGFAAQSFRISNAITSGSFGDWAFSKSLTDEAGEPGAANGGFSGGTRQPHFEVSFDIASTVPGAEQPGLRISVAPDRGDGARMSFLRFRDTPAGLAIDFADYQDAAPFGTSGNLAAGCGVEDDFVETTVASGLDRSVPHNIKLVMDFVPGPRNDVVRVFVDGALVHCGTTWEDYFRYCEATDTSRTVDSLLLQARQGLGCFGGSNDNTPCTQNSDCTGGGICPTAAGTLGNGFLVDNLDLESGPLVSLPAVCPTAAAVGQCAAPACPAANCFVNDATGTDGPGCCTAVGGCKTIQGGVNDAVVGDVIDVAAGTYPEAAPGPLTINKTLTLCGAQDGVDARTRVGAETIVTDPQGTYVTASNVIINGFTIQDVDQSAFVFTGYGILMGAGTTGTQVLNNIIQDNTVGVGLANTGVSQVLICQNLIQNNNVPGSATGAGIYTDEFVCGFGLPCTNFLVEQNAFKGNDDAGIDISNTSSPLTQLDVSTNTFDMNGRGIFLFNTDMSTIHNNSITNSTTPLSGAIRLFGDANDLSITSNNLNTGAGWGIRMSADFSPPNSGVVINLNNIAGFFGSGGPFGGGLLVGAGAHVGPVDAECNWWDDPCGPFNVAANPLGIGEEVEEDGAPGDADFTPWLIAPGPAPASGGGTCTGIMRGAGDANPNPNPERNANGVAHADGDRDGKLRSPAPRPPRQRRPRQPSPPHRRRPEPPPQRRRRRRPSPLPLRRPSPPPLRPPPRPPARRRRRSPGRCRHPRPRPSAATASSINQARSATTATTSSAIPFTRRSRPSTRPRAFQTTATTCARAWSARIPRRSGAGPTAASTSGRLTASSVPMAGSPINFSAGDFSISLTTLPPEQPYSRLIDSRLVFQTSLPAGAIGARSNGGFKYKNHAAKQDGGIYQLNALPTNDGTFKVTIISYGDLSGAEDDMVTHFIVDGHEWTVHALWRQTRSGWVFDHALP